MCVARNLDFWLSQLQNHTKNGTPGEEILKSLPVLFKALGYLSDASGESVKLSARAGGLAVAARRGIWLKTWFRDSAYKLRLCNLASSKDLLFGLGLDIVFPTEKQKTVQKSFFRGQKDHKKK